MKTFSLINKKGGVGKTTITVNLAYALAESCDLRVLVIDNDDQGNDTQFFGIEEGRTLADILLQKAGLSEVIQHTRYPMIDIVPSSEALLDANVVIIKDEDIVQQNILREAMQEVEEQYDICLIDNPPTINASVINALVASDEVIIISSPDKYSIRGAKQMLGYIEGIKEYNPGLRYRGCLLNKYNRTWHGMNMVQDLNAISPVFNQRIRYTKDKLEASAAKGECIFEYSPNCGFAQDLKHFLTELLMGE